MEKSTFAVFLAAFLSLTVVGCHDDMVIDGTTYEPVGVADQDNKSPDVKYDVVWGNVVWSVIFCETIVVPIILVGWYLWEPVGRSGNVYRPPAKK